MLNDYRHMMFDYFIKRARRNYIKRKERIKKIKDAEEYKREVKEKIKKIFGKFPEKTPLNLGITGVLKIEEKKL
jgi:hypothetical protein